MRNATAHGTSSVAWGKWSHPKWGRASCYHPARCSLTSQDSIGQNYVHVLPDPFTSAQGVFRDPAQSKVHPQVHRKSPDQVRIFRSTRNEENTELPTQWLSGTPDFPLATAVRTSKHLFRKFATPEASKNHRWVDRVRWCEVLIDRSTSTSLLSWNGLTDRLTHQGTWCISQSFSCWVCHALAGNAVRPFTCHFIKSAIKLCLTCKISIEHKYHCSSVDMWTAHQSDMRTCTKKAYTCLYNHVRACVMALGFKMWVWTFWYFLSPASQQ